MNNRLCATILALSIAFFGVAPQVLADPTRNPPLVCAAKASCSTCPTKDGCACGCILVTLDLGATTAWTGQTPVYLRIHSSDETASLSTPAQLKVVMGWSFKAVDGGTTAGGAPQIVRFVQPEGAELVVHFQDGDSVGVPEPNNLGKSLARVRMVDAEGWATTSAPAFYDLYPGDGSVWRFLATGNTNERGALVSFTDPRGRVLTPDDFGVDIVRDALGNIRQVKTLTRLADVRTLSPTHYAVTVYPLAEEPEQVADTGLYALPEHTPTRVLDVAQGESVKELLVGFQKGTGDMRQYRYVAVNGDWTLYQPSGLVEAQELYFTEDESGAQRLHTIRDETGKLWSRDEYNYVSAYWGYLITNRIEGIPGDATRTTSWSYYTDGPHKDLLRETVEPTGNRILYEYDAQNRVIRESMPLVEEETLYSYEPVDPSDPPLLCDTRPRCVVRKMQGIEIQRTYYVYGTNGVDVVERVGEQGAAYGGTNVLRTVTTYYPVTGAITDGLVQSVRHEDGTIDNYAYGLTDGVWTETITHVHEQAPDIVPMRTTRSVRVYNALGQLVDSRTDLCTIGVEDLIPQADWTPIERMQHAYDIHGHLVFLMDNNGKSTQFEWGNACCGKTAERSWEGQLTTYAYDAEGRLSLSVLQHPDRKETHHKYDVLGREIAQWTTNTTENIGTTVSETRYDSLGRIVGNSNQNGNWTMFRFSSDGLTRETNFGNGAFTLLSNDVSGRIVSSTGSAAASKFYRYEVLSNGCVKTTVITGNTPQSKRFSSSIVNMLGHPFLEYVPGANQHTNTTITLFDRYGRPSRVVSNRKPEVSYGYDEWGILTEQRLFADNQWRAECISTSYLATNGAIWRMVVQSKMNSDERTPIIVSEDAKKVTGIELPNLSHHCHKDAFGNISESWEVFSGDTNSRIRFYRVPWARNTSFVETVFGKTVRIVDRASTTNCFFYDALGRKTAELDGRGNRTAYGYFDNGLVSEIVRSDGFRTTYEYDSAGRIICVTNTNGNVSFYEYDCRDRLVRKYGAEYPAQFQYDEFDNLVAFTTYPGCSEGSTIQLTYDDATGLLFRKGYPDATGTLCSYDDSGMLTNRTWARGVETKYQYNGWGAVTNISYSDETPMVSIQYDAAGRPICIDDVQGESRLFYDNRGWPVEERSPLFFLHRRYDSFGRDIGCSNSFGGSYSIEYDDNDGRIAKLVFGESTNLLSFVPGSDLLSEIRFPLGQKRLSYNIWNNGIREIEYGSCLSPHFLKMAYLAPTNEWILKRSLSNDELLFDESFLYNSRNELTRYSNGEAETEYSYDSAGNRTALRSGSQHNDYEIDNLGKITTIESTRDGIFNPLYDEDGNQTLVKSPTGLWMVEYNAENRPIRWRNDDVDIKMLYDWQGRRVFKQVKKAGKTVSEIRFGYDGFRLIVESHAEGITNLIYWGIGDSRRAKIPLAYSKNGVLRYFLNDHNGSVIGDIDECGVIRPKWAYDPFGNDIISESPHEGLGYSAEYGDSETGCIYYNYRHYNPRDGRWLTRDPKPSTRIVSEYGFCNNQVPSQFDLLGLEPPEKPKNCNKPCSCKLPGDTDDNMRGTLKCKPVTVEPRISGGKPERDSHDSIHKGGHPVLHELGLAGHPKNENRQGKPECWNPSYCFDTKPECADGYVQYNRRAFLNDGKNVLDKGGVSKHTPNAWDFDNGMNSESCYEVGSSEFDAAYDSNNPTDFPNKLKKNLQLSIWCTKCIDPNTETPEE